MTETKIETFRTAVLYSTTRVVALFPTPSPPSSTSRHLLESSGYSWFLSPRSIIRASRVFRRLPRSLAEGGRKAAEGETRDVAGE